MSEPTQSRRAWPRLAASAAIFRDGSVLLGERGKGAMAGLWSLPGGHVEPGETAARAAEREVREETGVDAQILGLIDLHEVIRLEQDGQSQGELIGLPPDPAVVSWHYVIAVHYGLWRGGEPVAASDCRTARFVPLAEVGKLPLTDGAMALIERGARLLHAAGDRTAGG